MINDAIKKDFLAAMATRSLSLATGKDLIADGQWHRCNTPKGEGNGSYLLVVDGPVPFGHYRNWQDGRDVDFWRGDRNRPLNDAEQRELDDRIEAARVEHERIAAEMSDEARQKARQIWTSLELTPEGDAAAHPYVTRKRIKPSGAVVDKHGNLVVPIFALDGDDQPVNLQFIASDGHKYFLRGGRTKGCACRIPGTRCTDYVVVCEGFATAATIAEATGARVYVVFSASNISTQAPTDNEGACRGDPPTSPSYRCRLRRAARSTA
jgi:putative DNA primase/helicase